MAQGSPSVIPAFLLGAGASIGAGFPSTQLITDRVFSGNGIVRNSDETYSVGGPDAFPYPYVSVCTQVVAQIRAAIEPVLLRYRGRQANYEDVVYALAQIADFETAEIENPLVRPFIDQIRQNLSDIALQLDGRINSIGRLARETENYVRDVAWGMLNRSASRTDHLVPIVSSIKKFGAIIGTLNHDNHLERHLIETGLSVADGFGPVTSGVRYYQASYRSPAPNDATLFKLHGSVDWHRLRPDEGTQYDWRVGIPIDGDAWHARTEDGKLQLPESGRPIMIMGTFNKYVDYASALFASTHSRWRLALEEVGRLVICGYSFGDKGINAQVVDWLYAHRDNRCLVVDPSGDALIERARGAIRNSWAEWCSQDKVSLRATKLEDLEAKELEDFFVAGK